MQMALMICTNFVIFKTYTYTICDRRLKLLIEKKLWQPKGTAIFQLFEYSHAEGFQINLSMSIDTYTEYCNLFYSHLMRIFKIIPYVLYSIYILIFVIIIYTISMRIIKQQSHSNTFD